MKTLNTTKLIEVTFAALAVVGVAAVVIPNAAMIAAGVLVAAGLAVMGAVEAKARTY